MLSLRKRILCISLIVITFAVLVGTVIATNVSTQYEIVSGGVCPEDIYATRTIIDTVTTHERKSAAADSVEDIYSTDYGLIDSAVNNVNTALSEILTARENSYEAPTNENGEADSITNSTYLSDRMFNTALSLTDSEFDILRESVPAILKRVMTEGVTDKKAGIDSFTASFEVLNVANENVSDIARALCGGAIVVNKTFNEQETQKQKEIAANNVPNVTYMKNQVIARRGEIISDAQYAMLKELGFVQGAIQLDIFHTASVICLLLLVVALSVLYYLTIGKSSISSDMATTALIACSLTMAGALISFFGARSGGNMMYLMPLSLTPALIALLLGGNLACVVNIIIATLAGILTNEFSFTVSIILAGAATSFVFARVRRRTHLLYSTITSAFAYALAYSVIFLDTSKDLVDGLVVFAIAFAGGFLGGILSIGTIPFWEAIFDVITPMKLSELSNPEHKLLKTLLINAPGSYHHSLTVANMAEAAANAIGANALLARVGAYYHDIGKMENPLYFKENQFGDENIHDELPPEESAAIILKHVSDGLRLASQHHLPSAVKDIILQHHGTTTVSFFLYKARQANSEVDPSLFTYPGPKVITKEATIIMLADACEAAVRAMREKGSVDASSVIDSIVATRISEGQLSSSALSFSDLEKVKESFVKTLDQYFHKRILYPQNEKKD